MIGMYARLIGLVSLPPAAAVFTPAAAQVQVGDPEMLLAYPAFCPTK
jgi:hypothetical protein